MRVSKNSVWTSLVTAGVLSGLVVVVGCNASGQIGGQIGTPEEPPPAPPAAPAAPVDEDGDGVTGDADKCPAEKEDGKGPDTGDGCPTTDSDEDGVPVPADKCPTEPETKNDFEDEDGCPDKKPLVQVIGTEVKINQKIQFKKGKADIEDSSKDVLDAVAETLKKFTDIQVVEVGGHASQEGNPVTNRQLSQKRVEAVVKALVARGIAKERLIAQGYGSYCVVDAGTTEDAMEKNRRVEFKILVRADKETGMARGCEASEKAGVKPAAYKLPKPATPPTAGGSAAKDDKAKATPPAPGATPPAATPPAGDTKDRGAAPPPPAASPPKPHH